MFSAKLHGFPFCIRESAARSKWPSLPAKGMSELMEWNRVLAAKILTCLVDLIAAQSISLKHAEHLALA